MTSIKAVFLSSCGWAALVASTFSIVPSQAEAGVTITARTPSFVDVSAAVALASDGDTVIVPAGTAAWTTSLVITKGITLMGQTTTNAVAGTANDQTIIQDNVTRAAGGVKLITVQSVAGKTYRVSGLTFRPLSTVQNNNGFIALAGNSHAVRLDHCHFQTMTAQSIYVIVAGAIYGVMDHNVLEFNAGSMQSIVIHHDAWGGQQNGDGAWADSTAFGSEKFFFIEDNYLSNTRTPFYELTGNTDSTSGGRWVFRHNHCYDIEIQTHGTESGRYRGARAIEVYSNDFHSTVAHGVGGLRSGVLITHDNTWDGVQPTHGIVLQEYRGIFKWVTGPNSVAWLGASGDSSWDLNDTEGNGTNVPGHSPFLYESGTVSSGSGTTMVDTTKNWAINRWVNFTVKRVSDNQIGLITANTGNTLTVFFYPDSGGGAIWTASDHYQIHKCLAGLDQPGRGQCDLITGTTPINTVTGTAAWPHQALEPCYSWNDKYTPNNASVNLQGAGSPSLTQQNRDYYNNTPMPGYTPYTYPHPLVAGGPAAPTNLRVIPGP
jgi:hypothetical protein